MSTFKCSCDEYGRRVSDEETVQNSDNLDLEMYRLNTFANCPSDFMSNFSFIRLADAGFYYNENDDSCRCFSCDVVIRNESIPGNSDPRSIHGELSTSCRFIRTLVNRQEENINPGQSFSANPITARCAGTEVRLSNNVDSTYRHNERNDEDTRLKHGSEVHNNVTRVNMDTGYSTFSVESVSSSHTPDQSSLPDNIQTQTTERPVDYRRFEMRLASFINWPLRQSSSAMAAAGFFYLGNDDCVECFHCGLQLRGWKPNEDPWIEHAKWFPECNHLVTDMPSDVRIPQFRMMHMQESHGYAENIGGTANDIVLIGEETEDVVANGSTEIISKDTIDKYMDSPAVQAVLELAADRENEAKYIKETLECLCLSNNRPNAVEIYSVVEKLKERDNKIKDAIKEKEQCQRTIQQMTECGICCTNERCMLFCPCGHLICCEQCSARLLQDQNEPKCPACRRKIQHSTKVFRS